MNAEKLIKKLLNVDRGSPAKHINLTEKELTIICNQSLDLF